VPHLRSSGRGDLLVHMDVATPTKLDARQEELLREFAAVRGEESPQGTFESPEKDGLFSRIRDAFSAK
jgi:molecular chaperone DnaJ